MALKVHVTGVTGLIGDVVYAHLAAQPERYEVTGSGRRYEPSERVADGHELSCPQDRFTRADLTDLGALEQAFAGAEVVVHMGAIPDPAAPFDDILRSNVVGSYNALEACRRQGVRRILYASTVMTDWGYQFDEPYKAIREARFDGVPADFQRITHRDAVRPTEPYSASKVWGEGLCRAYADGHGLSCLCLRIGGVNADDAPRGTAGAALWCSHRDIATAVELAVTAPIDLRFDIFYVISANPHRWIDAEHTRNALGFSPRDRSDRAQEKAHFWKNLLELIDSAPYIKSTQFASELRQYLSRIAPPVPPDWHTTLSTVKASLLVYSKQTSRVKDLADCLQSLNANELDVHYEQIKQAKQLQAEAISTIKNAIAVQLNPTDTTSQPSTRQPTNPTTGQVEATTPTPSQTTSDSPHHRAAVSHDTDASTATPQESIRKSRPTTTEPPEPILGSEGAQPNDSPVNPPSDHRKCLDSRQPDTASDSSAHADALLTPNDVHVPTSARPASPSSGTNGDPSQTLEVFDAVLREGRVDLAYWISYSSNECDSIKMSLGEHSLISPSVLGALCESRSVTPGDSCPARLAHFFDDIMNSPSNWMDHERMLLSASVIAPLLFLQPHPPSLYSIVKSPAIAGTPLSEFIGRLDKLCLNRNVTLRPRLLATADYMADSATKASDLAGEATDFLARVPTIGFNYAPAERVLQYVYRARSEMHRLHKLVASNSHRRVGEVQALCNSLAPRTIVMAALRAPDFRHLNKLEGRARAKLERHLFDSLRLASEWVEAAKRSRQAEGVHGPDGEAYELRRIVERDLPRIVTLLSSDQATPVERMVTIELTGLLERLSNPAPRSSGIDQACISLPGVVLDDDMAPQQNSLASLPASISALLRDASDPADVFAECVDRDEYVRANRIVVAHRLGETFHELSLQRLRVRKRQLSELLWGLQIRIEDAFLLDHLESEISEPSSVPSSRLDRTGLLGEVDHGLKRLNDADIEFGANIRRVADTAREIEQQVTSIIHARRGDFEREIENFRGVFEDGDQGDGDWAYLRDTLADCIRNDDYVAAFDLLERARRAALRSEPIARATIGSSEHLDRFLRSAAGYQDLLRQPRVVRQLRLSIDKGRDVQGIEFRRFDAAQRAECIAILESWRSLSQCTFATQIQRERFSVEEICRFIGFSVADDSSTVGQYREGLAHVRITLSSAPTVSPLPVFGSTIGDRLDVVVSQRLYEPDQVISFIEQGDLRHRAVLVLLMHPVSGSYRTNWQRECSTKRCMALPVDFCLLLHLCGVHNRLPALFDIGFPFMWARPYITKGETVAPEMFVGRRAQIDSVSEPLGGCIVYGGRQLGKSALLTQVRRENRAQGTFVIYLDVDHLGIEPQSHDEMKRVLWQRVAEQLNRESGGERLPHHARRQASPTFVSDSIKELLAESSDQRIVLLLDETDNLLDLDSSHDFELVRQLRALMADTGRRFKVVFAGLQSVQRYKNWRNHPFAQLGDEIVITPLDPAAAQELIVRPFRALGFAFENTTLVLRILSLTNYHPGLIQIFCYRLLDRLYEKWRRQDVSLASPIRRILAADVLNIERDESIREDIRNRFDWTLDLDDRYKAITYALVLTNNPSAPRRENDFMELGRDIWPAVFQTMDPQGLRAVLDEMVGLGVLIRDQGDGLTTRYRLRSPNLLRLLGPDDSILSELARITSTDRPRRPNPRHFRSVVDTRPVRFGPLSKEQEASISDVTRPFTLTIVLGSSSMGLTEVAGQIRKLMRDLSSGASDSVPDPRAWREIRPSLSVGGAVNSQRILQVLKEGFRIDRRSHRYTIVDFESIYFDDDIAGICQSIVQAGSRYCTSKSRGKVIVLIGPSQMWNWIASTKRQQIEDDDLVTLINVRRWTAGAITNALDYIGLRTGSKAVGDSLLDTTSGVHGLVSEVLARSISRVSSGTDATSVLPVADEVVRDWLKKDTSALLSDLGIHDDGSALYRYLMALLELPEHVAGQEVLTQDSFETAIDALPANSADRDTLIQSETVVHEWLSALDLAQPVDLSNPDSLVLCPWVAQVRAS